MGFSIYNFKRWSKMLTGKSIYHVEQNKGKVFCKDELKGYFNDMTQKVILGDNNLDSDGIPVLDHSDGSKVHMPTMIFQYGLGAYDLWLIEKERIYIDKAILCASWAIENQNLDGSWNNFYYIYPQNPYSAMAQGEGISLLVRIYEETKDIKYLTCAKKAVEFMLKDIKFGGVADYENDELVLLEYTHLPVVMNGWIFAAFGLYDYNLVTGNYREEFDRTIVSLEKSLPQYDCGYWSMYDSKGKISSPFYHNLHIAQMQALFDVTGKKIFYDYGEKFSNYQKNVLYANKAFIRKAFQKITE